MEIESSTTHGGAGWQRRAGNPAAVVEIDRHDEERQRGSWLVWEELTVVLPNLGHGPPRRLLQGLNGYAEPGRIMAVMGPSASGKSTLLDSLAGRLSRNVIMTGDILVNGKKRRLDYGFIAYVTQEDVLLGTLTVKETIQYSALLRLPTHLPKPELDTIVEDTIISLGLQDCANRVIGNWHRRGISGGEKKRLSIALETLTKPQLLFLDEPTTGLDSASSFFVVQMLRNIAQEGRTVVSSIHQPSSEVFALFDDLFLLSGGETVYCGEAKMAVQFFGGVGFPCPRKRNPSDHFLRCINSDFDAVKTMLTGSKRFQSVDLSSEPHMKLATAEMKALLIHKYTDSEYHKRVKSRIRELTATVYGEFESTCASQATWRKQLTTLTRRSVVNMSRDIGYYWLRIVIYLIVSLSVGTVFYNVGYKYSSILARVACGGFISGFMTFLSIGGFPSFVEEMKVFYKERRNGYYGVGVYTLSNFLSSLPFLVAIGVGSGTITNYMVSSGLESGFSHYIFLCLDIFGCIAVIESLMMVIASLVPNYLMGVVIGAGIMGILMMTSGFFRLLRDLPKPFWRYPISYLNYGAWALQGGLKNDMLGLEFEALNPGDPKLKGDVIITTMFGTQLDHSKWWDLAAVFGILIAYRLLFFIILKFEERISPLLRRINAKQTLYRLEKSPFFRPKTAAAPSRRHQPIHALSSQEGLSSPLPDKQFIY